MDPMSALSVAAAVIQFVDFGSRLVSTTYKIYRSPSGQTSKNVALAVIGKDLAHLTSRVEVHAKALRISGENTSSETFLRLCNECKEISLELHGALDRLQASGTRKIEYAKSSFLVALKTIWSESKVKILEHQMSEARQQVIMSAVVCLWCVMPKTFLA